MNMIENGKRKSIIGITGMPGSGKGEVSGVAKELGIPVRSIGDIVRSHFSGIYPDDTMKNIGKHANDQRDIHGEDIWAKRLVDDMESILKSGYVTVIIDGVRSPSEVGLFKDRWRDSFSVLCIHSSPSTRYNRLISRGRTDDPDSLQEFDERDARELSWGLGQVIARADLMMVNEGSREQLKERSLELWREKL